MRDFKTAWQQAKRTGNIYHPDLYAASIYGQRQKPQPQKMAPQRPPYIPWTEFQGHRQLYTTGYSPTLFQAQHKAAMAVFQRAESTLNRFREVW